MTASHKNQAKRKAVQTSSIVLNLGKSNWAQLTKNIHIWEYRFKEKNTDYAKIYQYIKSACKSPHYYSSHEKILLLVMKPGATPPVLKGFTTPSLFDSWEDTLYIPIWYKALFSCFCYRHQYCVGNQDSYLFLTPPNKSKSGNAYTNVLKVTWNHYFQDSSQQEHVFVLDDRATRMKRQDHKELADPNKWRPGKWWVLEKINKLNIYREVIPEEVKNLKPKAELFNINTHKKSRSKLTYMNVKTYGLYEKTRLAKLFEVQRDFLTYLEKYGISASARWLDMTQYAKSEKDLVKLDHRHLTVYLHDARLVKDQPFSDIVDLIQTSSKSKYPWAQFIAASEAMFSDQTAHLIVLDYTEDAYKEFLAPQEMPDAYKLFKAHLKEQPSQGLCVNKNDWAFKPLSQIEAQEVLGTAKHLKLRQGEFFSYSLPNQVDPDWIRNLEISLKQLFLKEIIVRQHPIKHVFPAAQKLKDWCFITQNTLLHVSDQLNFYSLDSKEAEDILKIKIGYSKSDINRMYLRYKSPPDKELNLSERGIAADEAKIMACDGRVWLVRNLFERPFYELEEVKARLKQRDQEEETLNFQFPLEASQFFPVGCDIQAYNRFIKKVAESDAKITYSKLKKCGFAKETKGNIRDSLKIDKDTPWLKALKHFNNLDFKGIRSDNLFEASQGIWYEPTTLHYFVGSKDGMPLNQEKGIQMRKLVSLAGTIDSEFYFSLLNVDFIRHKGFTVQPYPFSLIKIRNDMVEKSLVHPSKLSD